MVTGTIRDVETDLPIPRATVRVGEEEFTADQNGIYEVKGLAAGSVGLTAAAEGYADHPASLKIDPGEVFRKDFHLDPAVRQGHRQGHRLAG